MRIDVRALVLFVMLVAAAFCFFYDAQPSWRKRFGMQSLGFMFATLAALVVLWPF